MANGQERTFGEQLNTWVQIVGIIGAATWGAYTFVYKEIMIPRSAPINITLNLNLRKIEPGSHPTDRKNPLIPVEMKISATNPSSRTIHLLRSAWKALGHHIIYGENKSFDQDVVQAINSRRSHEAKYSRKESSSIVAAGGLFPDSVLKPGETLTRTVIFHVPPNQYNVIEVSAMMPSAVDSSAVELEWKLGKDLSFEPLMYRLDSDGKRTPLEKDKDGSYSDSKLELQSAISHSALSL
jgi:hypothetical protein